MKPKVLILLIVLGLSGQAVGTALGQPLIVMVSSLLLISVFGEIAVHGVEGLAERLGLSGYASSVLVNSLAVMPELLAALALGYRGLSEGNLWIAELALLSVLVSAIFNLVVLGVVALLAEGVSLEADILRREAPLMRVAVASTGLLAAYGVVEAAYTGRAATPYPILVAQLAFWVYYTASIMVGERVSRGRAARLWWVPLAAGLAGLVYSAESLASSIEETIHVLHIEHLGEAALAVGIASSAPEAVLAVLSARRGAHREAAGGLLAATSTSLLMVFPAAYALLAESLALDVFTTYTLVMLASLLWVVKRSLLHENMIDSSEAMYILVLSAAALATLAYVK